MPDFLASSGPVDVIASGTIIAFNGNPIEIVFDALASPLDLTSGQETQATFPSIQTKNTRSNAGEWFKLIFRFVDETPTAPGQVVKERIETKREEGDLVLGITLFNFTSPLGAGTTKPVRFGWSGERNLYLHYRVFALAGGDKTLYFAVFQSRIVDHRDEVKPSAGQQSSPDPKKETNA